MTPLVIGTTSRDSRVHKLYLFGRENETGFESPLNFFEIMKVCVIDVYLL